jgi:hypothetical protein
VFKRTFLMATFLVAASTCGAETLTGTQIEPALNDVTVWYEPLSATSPRQFFNKNGQTPYVDAAGTKTFGAWLVRGDKYCSQWPPSEHWTCYGVARETLSNGTVRITFISGGDGKLYPGIAKPGKHIDEAWAE